VAGVWVEWGVAGLAGALVCVERRGESERVEAGAVRRDAPDASLSHTHTWPRSHLARVKPAARGAGVATIAD
jgi:hypothetical protein